MPDLNYRSVEPIGTRKAWGHQNMGAAPHVWGEFDLPDYPESPEGRAFAQLRRELRIGLRKASELLELRAVQVSALEHGAAVCDWSEAERRLRAAREGEVANG